MNVNVSTQQQQPEIIIIDSIMGSGKTTWAINYVKEHIDENFIYITPYIDETKRIKEATAPERNFVLPRRIGATNGKLNNLNIHVKNGDDIASTHELFKRFDENTKNALMFTEANGYTLIIDETLDVVVPHKITQSDITLLLKSGAILVDEDGFCHWNKEFTDYDGKFEETKQAALSNNLVCVKEKFFLWRLDPEIFKNVYFEKIYVMTYIFEGSIMKTYFEYYDISYKKVSVKDGVLVPYYKTDIAKEIAGLINLYEGPLNESFEQKGSSLSATWYKNKDNEKYIKQLKRNVDNYFRNILKAKASDLIWSTFLAQDSSDEETKTVFGKTRYDKQFVSCNVKGTNQYMTRSVLAYTVNVFLNPGIQHLFTQKKIHVNSNLYALQNMLQWIWRSRIRNNQPISIYIPSIRMRELLVKWMNNKNISDKK